MPRYLRARVAAQRPTKRPVGVLLKKGVLLLNPKPEFGQVKYKKKHFIEPNICIVQDKI